MKRAGFLWTCPACRDVNPSTAMTCKRCGTRDGESVATTPTTRRCPYDRSPILVSGVCEATRAYPLGAPCPFVCPVCRGPLGWAGDCEKCWGVQHRGDVQCFPGDRYDLFDNAGARIGDGQHWTLVERGPRGLVSPAHAQDIARLMAGFLAQRDDAPASIDDVLEHFPFRVTGAPR